ncbi:hypothetical protein N657DRAFT_280501 [Parathielavia appendiculata]|uniref:Conidiation-specific protein 10 n=1 Tax=Parathielavia appendiculata TaxID=2587402 RepID=A0AAN6Z4Y0_9PEZI|nr:hypothetical protein N657DRAFT_280501 [Parathielavia appendiculata]
MSGTQNTNPGNFANRPKDEVREIASKGGQASHSGGFASMDPDKQASFFPFSPANQRSLLTSYQREIASKGGHASSGSFEPGSERAREAGRKGGRATGGSSDDAE